MDNPTHSIGFMTLVRHVLPYRTSLVLVLLFMLGGSAISLVSPLLAGKVTANLLGEAEPVISLQLLLGLWLLLLAVQGLLGFGNTYLSGVVSEKLLKDLRVHLYDHLQSLPLAYFNDRKRGEVLALLTNDAAVLSSFVTGTLVGLLPQLVTFAGALLLIAVIDQMIAAIIAVVLPLFYLVLKVLGRKIRPLSRALVDEYAHSLAVVEENIHLLPAIKAYTREPLESERVLQSNQRLLKLRQSYLLKQSMIAPVIQFLAAAGILALVYLASLQLQMGEMTAPQLVSLLLYGLLLTRPVSVLADVYGRFQYARGASERLIEAFTYEPEPLDQGRDSLQLKQGAVRFSGIYFAYPGQEPVLDGLDLAIHGGETVAITGENGAGKSTLAHLLMRFIEPASGQVLIDEQDIQQVTLTSLRQQIGLVQQHVLLLNATVRDNIAFGMPDASEQQIREAAQSAHALEFIETLPLGFDTVIGDQGVKLSGGQKQRLALARALLKRPAILILDEATAMFDPHGEQRFIAEAQAILRNSTVLIITHRPATLALAERVFRIEQGHAIEITHQAISEVTM